MGDETFFMPDGFSPRSSPSASPHAPGTATSATRGASCFCANIKSSATSTTRASIPRIGNPILDNPAFVRQTARDQYWGAKRVVAFSESEIRAAAALGHYPPATERRLAEVLLHRRDAIARAFFRQVAALDYFEIANDRLRFPRPLGRGRPGRQEQLFGDRRQHGRAGQRRQRRHRDGRLAITLLTLSVFPRRKEPPRGPRALRRRRKNGARRRRRALAYSHSSPVLMRNRQRVGDGCGKGSGSCFRLRFCSDATSSSRFAGATGPNRASQLQRDGLDRRGSAAHLDALRNSPRLPALEPELELEHEPTPTLSLWPLPVSTLASSGTRWHLVRA